MILSKCAICGSKKPKKASGVLSNVGLQSPLNKIPLLGDILL